MTYPSMRSVGTQFPPGGPAGGDLSGTYPNPSINRSILPPGPQGPAGASTTDELIQLLVYAFQRIQFLENCLNIQYKPLDINIPEEIELLQQRGYDGL